MSRSGENEQNEAVPAIPRKIRETMIITEPALPSKQSVPHSEADINARLGIVGRRLPLSVTHSPTAADPTPSSVMPSSINQGKPDPSSKPVPAPRSLQKVAGSIDAIRQSTVGDDRSMQKPGNHEDLLAPKPTSVRKPIPPVRVPDNAIIQSGEFTADVKNPDDHTPSMTLSTINSTEFDNSKEPGTMDGLSVIKQHKPYDKIVLKPESTDITVDNNSHTDYVVISPKPPKPSTMQSFDDTLESSSLTSQQPPGKLKIDDKLARGIMKSFRRRPKSSSRVLDESFGRANAVSVAIQPIVDGTSSATRKTQAPTSPDICMSDDGLSDGGEFYEEFSLPSDDVMIKCVPIVPTQTQQKLTEKKGIVYKLTSDKSSLTKFTSPWQPRYLTLNENSLRLYGSAKSYVSKRVIPVRTMVNVEQDIKEGEVHPFRFRLKTVDRVFRFAVDTIDELALWTSLIMKFIIATQGVPFRTGGDMNAPNMQGVVRMEGVRGRRVLAIKKGSFCFYYNERDFIYYSPIHQVDLQLGSIRDIGQKKLQLQTPQVAFTFLFDTQEEVSAWKTAFETGISYALGDDKVLTEVYENPSNQFCADCNAPGPEWAAINMGITLCQNCAGVHRTMINAKIRSLRMDSKVWTRSLIELMKAIGNTNANQFWASSLNASTDGIDYDDEMSKRVQFINSKYKEKSFCSFHPCRGQQAQLNELLCKSVQTSNIMETMQLVFSGADVWCTGRGLGLENVTPMKLAEEAKQTLQLDFLLHNGGDSSHQPKTSSDAYVPKAEVTPSKPVESVFSGYLHKTAPGSKGGFQKRYFVLKAGILSYFESEKSNEVKDAIDRREMIGVSIVTDDRMPYTFELSTSYMQGRCYLLAADSKDTRSEWMSKLFSCIAPIPFAPDLQINNIVRAGAVYCKFGATMEWVRSWICVSGKSAYVCQQKQDKWSDVDLRKAISIKQLPVAERYQNGTDTGPPIFVDLSGNRMLYLQGDTGRETEGWLATLQRIMTESNGDLSSRPLTADNVPVIVDKLVNFVSSYGLQTEGVYRHCGQNSVVARLLDSLTNSKDGPRSVCLRPEDYQVHDAANALKRFMRNLDDAVMTKALYQRWLTMSTLPDNNARVRGYKGLLKELPTVHFCTLKRVIFHLVQIAENENENKMNYSSLATIFGPVLLTSEKDPDAQAPSNYDIAVVRDLLENCRELFFGSEQEFQQAQKLNEAHSKLNRLMSQQSSVNEIRFTIYINSRDGKPVDIMVSPNMKAWEMLSIAVEKSGIGDQNRWLLQEVVCCDELGQCSGKLERPIHLSELVNDIIRRWSQWPEDVCRNNYIAVRPAELYDDIFVKQPFNPASLPFQSELRYCSLAKNKFSKHTFDFRQPEISYRKEKNVTVSWNVHDIVLFIGIPLRRNSSSPRCGFTFIPAKDPPTSSSFGHSISCSTDKELYKWLAAVYLTQHSDGFWTSQSKPQSSC